MERSGFTSGLRSTLFNALTGRQGDVSGQAGADVRSMLLAAFGAASTKSGVNLTAAAAGLGVSRRTVERYVTTAGQRIAPRGPRLQAIRTAARQAATTKRGRRTALADARRGPLSRYGAKISIRGEQGPTRAGTEYRRNRRVDLILDPDAVAGLWSAYEDGGDKSAVSFLEGFADSEYVPGWELGSIDSLDLGDPRES